jgi:hypothetical protein
MKISQGYINRILQHFATKLWNITNFVMLFHAMMEFCLDLLRSKFWLIGEWSISSLKIYYRNVCSHCLFPVVDKSGTSCNHLVTRLMRPTDSQQVVPPSLTSSARNKLLTSWWEQARSDLLRTACIKLVGTTCSKFVTVINLVTTQGDNNLFQTCHNNWEQAVRAISGLTTTLLQLVCRGRLCKKVILIKSAYLRVNHYLTTK